MLLIDTYLNDSSTEGLGLFTRNKIAKGTKIWEWNNIFDKEINEEDYKSLPESMKQFLGRYGYKSVIDNKWTFSSDLSRHMNHSDVPNTISDADSSYYAICDIEADTELTCDYNVFATEGCIDFLNNNVMINDKD